MKTLALLPLLFFSFGGFAQLYNYGGLLRLDSAADLFISGNYEHYDGILDNRGSISLKGNYLNNSSTASAKNISWGNLDLCGNTQDIGGASPLFFDSIILSGKGIKRLTNNVESNWIDLRESELATNNNIFHLLNEAPGGIIRDSGFISAKQKGGVCVSLKVPFQDYYVPLGYRNSYGTPVFRPVNLNLSGPDSAAYLVSVVSANDLNEGINYNARDHRGVLANHYYADHVSRVYGKEPIKVDFLFNAKEDMNVNYLLKWNSQRRVLETQASDYSAQVPNDFTGKISINDLNSFSDSTYILAYEDLSNLVVPNTITPNGDGDHDTWKLDFLKYFSDVEIAIYNRYGSKVFESKGNYQPWDGKYKGNTLPVGAYYYVINLNKGEQVLKGWVAIIM